MTEAELLERIKGWRKDLHAIPEMGDGEFKTSAYIEKTIGGTKPDQSQKMAGTGWKFVYRSKKPNAAALAFRADIDALPIAENSIYPHPSQHPGMMHACGHDGHMASVIALAHIASSMRDEDELPCDVVLLFQPAEETTGGAERMIDEGALENPRVDAVFGFHLMPEYDVGTIALSAGGVMAANTEFDLHFTGKRAHGAMPHLGSDTACAVANAYVAMQSYMTRAVPPTQLAVLTFGHIGAGNLRNIIADSGIMEGILRSYDNQLQDRLLVQLHSAASAVAGVYGVDCTFEQHCFYPATRNDANLVERVKPLLERTCTQQPLLTAEDFSFFGVQRPAVYAFVGTRDQMRTAPLHSDQFDFDEAALLPAIAWYTRIIQTFAKED